MEPKSIGDITEIANDISNDVADVEESTQLSPEITSPKMTNRQYANALLLVFVAFSTTLCYALIVPFFPEEAIRRGVTQWQIGFIFAIYQLVSLVSSSFYGKYLTAIGPKFLLVSAISCNGCAALIFGSLIYSPTGTTFIVLCLVLRAFQGICSSATNTSLFAITAKEFPDRVSSMVGIFESTAGLSFIVGPIFGGVIYQFGGFSLPLYIVGGLILFAAFLSYVFLPSHPPPTDPDEAPEKTASYLKLLRIPGVWPCLSSIISATMVMSFLDTTLAVFLDKFGINSAQKGLMFGILSSPYTLTSPLYGNIVDKKGWGRPLMFAGAITTGCGYILLGPFPLLPIQSTLHLAGLSLMIIGCGLSAQVIPPFKTILEIAKSHGFPDDMHTLGLVSGIVNTGFPLGAFIGPTVGGFLVETFQFPWTITILGMMNIGIAIFFLICFICVTLSSCFSNRKINTLYSPLDNESVVIQQNINS